jgi:phosphoserine aminotransferase
VNRIHNFSAGPAILPVSVLEKASQSVLELNGSGMSILEVSHRGKHYEEIHFDTMTRLLTTLGLPESEYSVCLLGGGASLQFAMLPMNFLGAGQTADYVNAGEWGSKAISEAKRVGNVHIAGSSVPTNHDRLPECVWSPAGVARYAHITTNNTVEGTQYQTVPEVNDASLVADMSSDIFAMNHDFSKFSMLYAGAQKNAGPAGVTMVVIKKDFLETSVATTSTNLSPMLSYKTQVEKDSLYNTPPVFSIYVLNLVLQWIESQGGVAALATQNQRKAHVIYDALDAAPTVYAPCVADKSHRSLMNITWRMKSPELEAELLAEAKANQMDGLKGHRNVGGFRASVYNAFPEEGCQALANLLTDFAKRRG